MPVYNKREILLLPKVIVLNPKDGKVTISVGITTSRPQDTLETMLKRADSLMYQSKRNGRNKVMTDISAEDI